MPYRKLDCYLLLAIFLLGCENSLDSNHVEYYLISEDHSAGYIYPPYGIYYEYSFKSYEENINSIQLINDLKRDDILVLDCWFRRGMNGCTPPGSNYHTNTIYYPVFIVLIENFNLKMEDHNFATIKNPKPIACGYNVERYTLAF